LVSGQKNNIKLRMNPLRMKPQELKMSEKIALLVDIQDPTLFTEMSQLIAEDKLLALLSDDPQSALEYITITDKCDYDSKANETVIFAGDAERGNFISCPPEADLLKGAIRRAYCHWETVNMNKAACNSVQEHGSSLEHIAQELSWRAKNFSRLAEIRQVVVNQLPIATIVVDEKSIVTFLNVQAHKLFQGLDVIPLGKPVSAVFPSTLVEFLSGNTDECNIILHDHGLSVRKSTLVLNGKEAGAILCLSKL
jgi:hypothetical protein